MSYCGFLTADESFAVTALDALLLSLLCAFVLFGPRRYAELAIFVAILFLSTRGEIYLGGLRMHAGRFIELAGFLRVLSRCELAVIKIGPLDRAVITPTCSPR